MNIGAYLQKTHERFGLDEAARRIAFRAEWLANMARPKKPTAREQACKYFQQSQCNLGYYGGHPTEENCQTCIAKGENTTQYSAKLAELFAKSHPAGLARISGCCDRADQA